MAALKPWLHFANAMQVNDGGAVDANEIARIEFFHQCLQGFSYVVDAARDVEPGVVVFGFNPVNIGDGDENDTAARGDGKALRVIGLGARAVEQREEALCGFFILAAKAALTRARERSGEAVGGKGLKQIVNGIGIECIERITIECSYKYGDRHVLDTDGFNDAKAVHFGHLHIEKDQIRLGAANGVDGGLSIAALADDTDAGLALEQAR